MANVYLPFDYYKFQENAVRQSVANEINFYTKHKYEILDVTPYIEYLQLRIGLCVIGKSYDSKRIENMNINEYAKTMDILVFKKDWKKIKNFHKAMKIKEYLDTLKYSIKLQQTIIDKNRKQLYDDLLDGIQKKKFVKNKNKIIYDTDKMCITDIECLYLDKKKNLYYIELC